MVWFLCHTQDDPYHFQSFAQYLCLHTYKYQHKLKQNVCCVVYIDFNQIHSSLFYLENNLYTESYLFLVCSWASEEEVHLNVSLLACNNLNKSLISI